VTSINRVEAFSDGVFAIAITLLVLGIRLPPAGAPLGRALLDQWPAYFAYAVSFLSIGIIWIGHHRLFEQLDRSDTTFAFLNVVFLMVVAFIPFPTDVLAQRLGNEIDAQLAVAVYGVTLTVMSITFGILRLYASSRDRHLFRPDAPRPSGHSLIPAQIAPLVYLAITLTAFLNAIVPLILFVAYGLYWILPISTPYRSGAAAD
jgi:uncharacterized membrane protein